MVNRLLAGAGSSTCMPWQSCILQGLHKSHKGTETYLEQAMKVVHMLVNGVWKRLIRFQADELGCEGVPHVRVFALLGGPRRYVPS